MPLHDGAAQAFQQIRLRLRGAFRRARARCGCGRARRPRPRCRLPTAASGLRPARARRASLSSRPSARLGARRVAPPAARLAWRRARRTPPGPPMRYRRGCDAISSPSFSARSAALAWSASGRSRFWTSRSRSRARSTWLLNARELQLGTMPPALESSEPSRLLDERAALGRGTRRGWSPPALADNGARPRAEPDIREQLDDVSRRPCAPLIRYWPSPPRWSRRAIDTSS